MSIPKFTQDSAEFFANQVLKVTKGLKINGYFPKYTDVGPAIEIDGQVFQWNLSLKVSDGVAAAPTVQMASQDMVTNSNKPAREPKPAYKYGQEADKASEYDVGMESIDEMFNSKEFTQAYKEISND